MDLKPNPHSQEAEEACLGCILNAGEETYDIYEKALKWVRKPEAMYTPENEIVWNAITDLYKNNKVIDPITVTDACKDNMIQTEEGNRPLILRIRPLKGRTWDWGSQNKFEKNILDMVTYYYFGN